MATSSKMDTDTFLKACQDAEKLRPDDFEAISMLGNIHVLLMRFEEVRSKAKQGASNNPQGVGTSGRLAQQSDNRL